MTWFKVDDSFYDHPKVFDAPDCAVALWTRAGSWAARNLTDGFVPAGMPARLCDDPDTAVRELVRRGLWSRTKDGYRFHDQPAFRIVQDRSDIPPEVRRAVFARDGGACLTCGATEDLTLDHIWPQVRGGGHTLENLRVLCRSCNSRKGARV